MIKKSSSNNQKFVVPATRLVVFVFLIFCLTSCTVPQEEITLLQHIPDGGSYSEVVAFSPDATMVAYPNQEDNIIIWDIHEEQPLQTIDSKIGTTAGLKFSSDNKQLAISTNARVELWDIQTNKLLNTFTPEGNRFRGGSVALSPDGARIALNARGILRVWNVQDNTLITEIKFGEYTFPGGIIFSPDGNLVALDVDPIAIWDIESDSLVSAVPGVACSFQFSPDGSMLITTYWSRVSRWQVESGELINTFTIGERSLPVVVLPEAEEILALSFEPITQMSYPDQNQSAGNIFSLWDAEDGTMKWEMPTEEIGHFDHEYLTISPNGDLIALIGFSNGFTIWQINKTQIEEN